MAELAAPPPMPFVVGVNRSGTTLLRMMLDSHGELAIPPETHFVPEVIELCAAGSPIRASWWPPSPALREWGDFGIEEGELEGALGELGTGEAGPVLRCFYGLCAERAGKPRAGDKTPAYGRSMTAIGAALPEAHFIHVIRDGRDVALSIRDRSGERPWDGSRGRWSAAHRGRAPAGRGAGGGAYREVRYEALDHRPGAGPARRLRLPGPALARRDARPPRRRRDPAR